MTAALVQGNKVLQTWATIPNPLVLPNGHAVHCAGVGYSGGTDSTLAASYVDTPRNSTYGQTVVSQSYAIVSGPVRKDLRWRHHCYSCPCRRGHGFDCLHFEPGVECND